MGGVGFPPLIMPINVPVVIPIGLPLPQGCDARKDPLGLGTPVETSAGSPARCTGSETTRRFVDFGQRQKG